MIGQTTGNVSVGGDDGEKRVHRFVHLPVVGLCPVVLVDRRSGDREVKRVAVASNPRGRAFAAAVSGQPDKAMIRLMFEEKDYRIRIGTGLQYGARP